MSEDQNSATFINTDNLTSRKHISEKALSEINSMCISSVSHDFRTPLSIIYANLQLLEYHDFNLDKETIKDAFSLSRLAIKSLLRVLDKVTVIDSINKGRLEYKPAKVCLETLCTNLVKTLNEAEIATDRLIYIHDSSITEIEIDQYLFTSLFTHLIFNSLTYSKRDFKVVFESKLLSDNEIRFTVKDFGIGLSAAQLDVVNNFMTSDEKELIDGIGLGLIIVKECLLLQKGTIHIASEPGKGSLFTICLPISRNC